MQMTEIIDVVQQRADIDSTQAANDVLLAVAETLAERDLDDAQSNFAAQLPQELGAVLNMGADKNQEKFDAEEFVTRVGQKLDISEAQSRKQTHAALSAMLEGVSDGERVDVLNTLPDDFTPYATWNGS